jgi:ribonuclease D
MTSNFIFINNQTDIEFYANEMSNCSYIAIDTEFNRNNNKYLPQLCLVQICYKEDFAIVIDCLANLNLKPILDVIYNPNIVKVFHSCRQDLEMLFNLTNRVPKNIFDTQVASLVINLTKDISYEKLVKHFLNVDIDKSLRQSSWHKRPLNNKLINYAAKDVLYLYLIYPLLLQEIIDKNRESWLFDIFSSLENPTLYEFDTENFIKKTMHSIPSIYFNKVQALVIWREQKAKSLNLSRHLVLDSDFIKPLVLNNLNKQSDIDKIIKNTAFANFSSEIYDLLKDLINVEENKNIEPIKDDDKNLKFILKLLLDFCSTKYSINPFLIATNDDINDIVINNNINNKVFLSWRYEIFGKYINKLKNGEIGLTFEENKIVVKALK